MTADKIEKFFTDVPLDLFDSYFFEFTVIDLENARVKAEEEEEFNLLVVYNFLQALNFVGIKNYSKAKEAIDKSLMAYSYSDAHGLFIVELKINLLLGKVYYLNSEFEKASEYINICYSRILNFRNPNDRFQVLNLLGNLQFIFKNNDEAISFWEEALLNDSKKTPKYQTINTYRQIALAKNSIEDFNGAMEVFKKSSWKHPNRLAKLILLLEKSRTLKGLEEFEKLEKQYRYIKKSSAHRIKEYTKKRDKLSKKIEKLKKKNNSSLKKNLKFKALNNSYNLVIENLIICHLILAKSYNELGEIERGKEEMNIARKFLHKIRSYEINQFFHTIDLEFFPEKDERSFLQNKGPNLLITRVGINQDNIGKWKNSSIYWQFELGEQLTRGIWISSEFKSRFFPILVLFVLILWGLLKYHAISLEEAKEAKEKLQKELDESSAPYRQAESKIELMDGTVLAAGEILYLTKDGNYVVTHTKNGKKYYEFGSLDQRSSNPTYPYPLLMRVHQSYIVNILAITEIPKGERILVLKNNKGEAIQIPLPKAKQKRIKARIAEALSLSPPKAESNL